ncbi:MAG: hypothetical protein GY723_12755 [bacterium]|nr:hypothetical protein [bacterium]MCP5067647.1 hypothetical protein [bacterium]
MIDVIVFAGATLFAFVCLFAGRMGPGLAARDIALLSGSAGVGVAYLFVDIMPHLASKQRVLLATTDSGLCGFLEHYISLD